MKYILFIFSCFVFLMPCSARHEKSKLIKNIRGEYAITADSHVSLVEAKEKAREDAKKDWENRPKGRKIGRNLSF